MTTATFAEAATAQTTKDKSSILAHIDNMSKAHFDKNPYAVAANYAPDAAIYNLAPPLIHHGIDLEEKQAWFNTWNGPIEIEPRDFQVTVSGDTAVAWGYMRLTGNKIGVDHPVSFWMRETICLERQEDNWRVIHEHASVPFYMDGSDRPAFDLQP
jgi:ketosteroid isomerase-like protein